MAAVGCCIQWHNFSIMLNEMNLGRADLNLLVLFEAVLKDRHVARAAQRLHLSPSAVSHGLGRLRKLLHDPLFLKHPKGVVPTARALQLAEPIAEILSRTRGVLASATRFDAAKSSRRFVLGAPDAIAAVTLPPLLKALERTAPNIDLSVRALMPQTALAALDAREVDIAIAPLEEVPARFAWQEIYTEDFVIAMRAGHPLARRLTLERYCAASHLLVSLSGEPGGLVDDALKRVGRSRRVAVSVPSFIFALAVVAETDLIAALPRMLVSKYSARLPLAHAEAPVALPRSSIRVIAPKAALMDAGTSWLLDQIVGLWKTDRKKPRQPRAQARRASS